MDGDYPGPKTIGDARNAETLLIHGATVDARVFSHLIEKNKSLVALSIKGQEKGPQHGDPVNGHLDIIEFIEDNGQIENIVTHSTGSIWMANAYKLYPEMFADKKIVLIAPNFGKVSPSPTEVFLLENSYLLPDPFLRFTGHPPFSGVDEDHFKKSKEHYYNGKTRSFQSVKYYKALNIAMETVKDNLDNLFLNHNDVTLVIGSSDVLIDYDYAFSFIDKYNLKYLVIDFSSHHGLLLEDIAKEWLELLDY